MTPRVESTPAARKRGASIVALALAIVPLAGCEGECTSVVEADTGIPSDRPVILRVSWCDGNDCLWSRLDSGAPANPSPEGFQLSDRDGRWFVEFLDPPPKAEAGFTTSLAIREESTTELVVRATFIHSSHDDCFFLQVAGPPRP